MGRREKLVAAICVLMGSHKGSGAATLRGDKRILWGAVRHAFSAVAINGKATWDERVQYRGPRTYTASKRMYRIVDQQR